MAKTVGFSIRERVKRNEITVDEALAIINTWARRPPMSLVQWLNKRKGNK